MSLRRSLFKAIYYPDCAPRNLYTFASVRLWSDEVHFVTSSGDASDRETYTEPIKPLLGTCVFYNPNLQGREIKRITAPLLKRGLERPVFADFVSGRTDEAQAVRSGTSRY